MHRPGDLRLVALGFEGEIRVCTAFKGLGEFNFDVDECLNWYAINNS